MVHNDQDNNPIGLVNNDAKVSKNLGAGKHVSKKNRRGYEKK